MDKVKITYHKEICEAKRDETDPHICEQCWYLMHPGCKWMDESLPNDPWDARRHTHGELDIYRVRNCHQYRPLDYEHTKAKAEDLDDTGCKRLMLAIVESAVKEYRSKLLYRKYHGESDLLNGKIKSIEMFFRSDWFYELTDMDGERIIMTVKRDLGV